MSLQIKAINFNVFLLLGRWDHLCCCCRTRSPEMGLQSHIWICAGTFSSLLLIHFTSKTASQQLPRCKKSNSDLQIISHYSSASHSAPITRAHPPQPTALQVLLAPAPRAGQNVTQAREPASPTILLHSLVSSCRHYEGWLPFRITSYLTNHQVWDR